MNYPNYGYNYYPNLNNTPKNEEIVCVYVQGVEAAKSYPLAPSKLGVFIDIADPVIYTKVTDQFGRPSPLKILDYKERVESSDQIPQNISKDVVTREDFDNFKNEIREMLRPRQNYKKPQREEQ